MVGEIKAAGKKLLAFQAEVAELYKPVLKDTEIFVSLDSAATPFVTVNGAVRKAGPIPCEKPTTLFDVIMQAGGFTPEANLKRVRVTRLIKGEYRSQFFDMRSAQLARQFMRSMSKAGTTFRSPKRRSISELARAFQKQCYGASVRRTEPAFWEVKKRPAPMNRF